MSGHSKWSKIKRQKGTADQKRGNLFTKLGNNITVAARSGGGDPDMNFKLRLAMEKAKAANMPNDNMERAIKKGTGELSGEQLQEMVFEGYGPSGVALIMEAVASNRNRVTSVIRNILTKYGGKLGENGSVNWMFKRKGVIGVSTGGDKESIELKAIDAGANDISEEPEGIVIYTNPEELEQVKTKLEKNDIKTDYAEIRMVASNKVHLPDKDKNNFIKLQTELEESEEINNFYTNADLW